ncbi:MAG: hypothetical protein KDA78_13055 [Planctomycetaceae bacterium]|nr:hypothetical protein [Planctomycetaceae bacterium]
MQRAKETPEPAEPDPTAPTGPRIVRLIFLCLVLIALSLGYVYYNQLPDVYAEKTRAAEKSEDWEQVEKWAKKWVARSPDNGDAILFLSDAYRFQRKVEPLLVLMLQFPTTDSRYPTVMEMRGDLLMAEAKNIPAAEENWLILLNQQPLHKYARQRLTYIYSMTLQREKLQTLLRESLVYNCEPPEAYFYLTSVSNLNFTNGLLKTTEWLKQTPDNRELLVAQAVFAARSSGKSKISMFEDDVVIPGSDAAVDRLLKQFPDDVELVCHKLQQKVEEGELEAVEELLKQLSNVQTSDCRVYRYRGWLAKMQNEIDKAAAELQKGLQYNPLDWKCHLEMAQVKRLQSDKDAATFHADLAERGKVLERQFMELPSAIDASFAQMQELLKYIQDCGDQQAAVRLTAILQRQR